MNPHARPAQWAWRISTIFVIGMLTYPAGTHAQQAAAADKRLAFEVATVKLSEPGVPRTVNLPPPAGPNRLLIPSMTLATLIYAAYGDGGFNTAMRVTGGPGWVNSTTFAIEGIAAGAVTARELRLMLRTLIEDRFALKIRTEVSTNDMLTLVTAKSDGTLGPKVKPWSGSCPKVMPALYLQAPRRALLNGPPRDPSDVAVAECPSGYRADGITLDGVTMFTVAEVLSLPPGRALLGTIVSDQTGLTGRYTMELDYPFKGQRPAAAAGSAEFAPPSLFTAVEEQWGLKIVRGKGPFRLVVVESAQLPSPN